MASCIGFSIIINGFSLRDATTESRSIAHTDEGVAGVMAPSFVPRELEVIVGYSKGIHSWNLY